MTVPFGVGVESATLPGELTVPADAIGVVAFAHGSGSSRHSPRNTAVARSLAIHLAGSTYSTRVSFSDVSVRIGG